MRLRVGLALAHDEVRAVAVTANGAAWAAGAPIDSGSTLGRAIDTVLRGLPQSRWLRPVLSAVVGPTASQVKLVAELPQIEDADTLAAIIRESAGSFFLKNGVPLMTTGVRPAGAGTAWAAALDKPCVDAVRDACRARGWRFGVIAPVAVALPLALEDPAFTWSDGSVVLEVSHNEGVLQSVRTRAACATDRRHSVLHPVAALTALGGEAARYADAYGATRLNANEPLALDPLAAGWWTGPQVRRRFIPPLVLSALAILLLGLSPLGARWAERQARARADRVQPDQWRAIDSALAQLHHVTSVLTTVNEFANARANVISLLGDLARLLPDGAALASFELRRDTAQAMVLTSNPGTTIAAVKGIPGLVSARSTPATSPPVTPVRIPASSPGDVGAPRLQRVLLRFVLPHSGAPSVAEAR